MTLPYGITLFYGDDEHRIDILIQKLIQAALPEDTTRAFNLERIEDESISIADVLMLARSQPFMSKRRVIFIRQPAFLNSDGKKLSDEEKALLTFAENPNPETVVIFRYVLDGAAKGFLKKLLKVVDHQQCIQPKKKADISSWLRAEAKKQNKSFTPEAMAMLQETAINMSTLEMASELEKLFLYTAQEQDVFISGEAVKDIITPTPSLSIFNLTDAMTAGKADAALAAYEDCLALGSKPHEILSQLCNTIRRLLEVQGMLAKGMRLASIQKALNRHEFYVKKLINQAGLLPTKSLSRLYIYLIDCDVKSKSTSGLNMTTFVEEVLINCCVAFALKGRQQV